MFEFLIVFPGDFQTVQKLPAARGLEFKEANFRNFRGSVNIGVFTALDGNVGNGASEG